jgi:2-haloacid dehalogenase
MERWATFDCYGTLVDWNAGIGRELARVIGGDEALLLARYHEVEPEIQAREPGTAYREVMAAALLEIAAENGVTVSSDERDALGRSLPWWPVFPEVPEALREMRARGWKLAPLTNSDGDLIEASAEAIGVPFDFIVAAGDIGSYKPAHRHWDVFFSETGADRSAHVHVAQSYFHDIRPANELGLPSIWINRLGESFEAPATRELPDLSALPDTADELVPSRT